MRERTDWTCDYCGRTFHHERQKLHCSHFKSRRHKATRYHPYNAFAHCVGCHRKLEEDPYEFTAHAEIVYGEMTIERVARLACIPVRLKTWQMDELYQHMEERTEAVTGAKGAWCHRTYRFHIARLVSGRNSTPHGGISMCSITSINQAKQQRERDEAELRSVREMTEQHQKAMNYLHDRERELVNRLGLNKTSGGDAA